jgi:hypothetical protein
MKNLISALALAGMAALVPLTATAGKAVVTFNNPEDYTDFPDRNGDGGELMKELSDHIIKLAASLPPAQELKIEFRDIDLAGTVKPNFRQPRDIRVVRGRTDWPAITVSFTLSENGQVIKSGAEVLNDMTFLQRSNRYYPEDALRYEKKMLDQWMQERFGISQ